MHKINNFLNSKVHCMDGKKHTNRMDFSTEAKLENLATGVRCSFGSIKHFLKRKFDLSPGMKPLLKSLCPFLDVVKYDNSIRSQKSSVKWSAGKNSYSLPFQATLCITRKTLIIFCLFPLEKHNFGHRFSPLFYYNFKIIDLCNIIWWFLDFCPRLIRL